MLEKKNTILPEYTVHNEIFYGYIINTTLFLDKKKTELLNNVNEGEKLKIWFFKLKKTGVSFGTTCTCNPAASIVVCRVVPDQPLLLQPPPLRQYEHKLKTTFSLTPQTECRRKK